MAYYRKVTKLENSSALFYEQLRTTLTPGSVLADFFCTLYEKDKTKSEVLMCNKLVKVFGRFTVFFAIQDMNRTYVELSELKGSVYPLLYSICQSRFEKTHEVATMQPYRSLDGYIAEIQKDIEELSKRKKRKNPPSSEGLGR